MMQSKHLLHIIYSVSSCLWQTLKNSRFKLNLKAIESLNWENYTEPTYWIKTTEEKKKNTSTQQLFRDFQDWQEITMMYKVMSSQTSSILTNINPQMSLQENNSERAWFVWHDTWCNMGIWDQFWSLERPITVHSNFRFAVISFLSGCNFQFQ